MDANSIKAIGKGITEMNVSIKVDRFNVGYPNHEVITDFTGAIETGQFVGIFGANGTGKTTLLNAILGLVPFTGELLVLGCPPRRGNNEIGYLSQIIPNLHVNISGYALLAASVSGDRLGLPLLFKRQREEIDLIVSFVGAEHYIHRPFAKLSGGEQRRLLLAQALLGKPRLLLLDEPLANLDPHHQFHLIQLLQNIQKELGITILLTSHDVNPLLNVMTQVLYLAKGKGVIGSVNAIITSEVLSGLYGSPIEVIQQEGRIFVIHRSTGQIENVSCYH